MAFRQTTDSTRRTSWDKVGTHLTNAQKQFAESQKAAERIAERLERVTNERQE
ncbi:MAG: hypothetical protein AB7I33_05220 [Gemmatimonadales bacterium]